MIAVFDACTVINLLLVNNDDRYFKFAANVFRELVIVPEVFEEIKTHKSDNLLSLEKDEDLSQIIFNYLQSFVSNDNLSTVTNFVEKAFKYSKRNGEFFSVSHALARSRLGENELMENLLKTHFVTDDAPASSDFDYLYRINFVGRILDSIDLLTLFCLKDLITRKEVIDYCVALKLLYNKNAALLLQKLKLINEKDSIISGSESIILTKLIGVISEFDEYTLGKVDELIKYKEFKSIKNKHKDLEVLLSNFMKSNLREKIPFINQRISDLSKVWELSNAS